MRCAMPSRIQEVKPFQWYLFLVRVLVNAFFCGIFGTLSGLVALKSIPSANCSLGSRRLTIALCLETAKRALRFFHV